MTAEPAMRVRSHDLPEDVDLPRYWFYDSARVTHAANALNLLFPDGERFFVRSVRRYADRIDDPELKERVRLFSGQEAQHGRAHEQAFRLLEAQGFEIESFLRWYRRVAYGVIEPIAPPLLRLSVTAALEHFTAVLAQQSFEEDFLEHAHPVMRELLMWHSAEEIEHKDVAFDVLRAVNDSYAVRIAGLLVAGGTFVFFWNRAIAHLIRQDPEATPERLRRERREALARGQTRRFLVRAFVSYLRPGFHPNDVDNRGLARAWLAAAGRL